MRFLLSKEQSQFFKLEGYIEIDELLTPEKFQSFKDGINKALSLKAGDNPFLSGRDLWRESDAVKKVALSRALASVVSDLFNVKELRIAFDQFLPKNHSDPKLKKYLENEDWFEQSSVQGTIAGLLIFLDEKAGGGAFVRPGVSLAPLLYEESALFIAYATPKTVYIHNSQDPNTHYLMSLGLSYGDRITDKTHPKVVV